MKKLFFFSAMAIFTLSGCMFFGPPTAQNADGCQETDPSKQDDCLILVAMNEKDREACENVQDKDKQASCWLEIAVGTGDATACDNLGREAKEKCISDYSNTGLFNDMNACDQHEDVEACLIRLGGIKNNPIPCNRTQDYNACLRIVLEADDSDRSPCDNVEKQDRLDCIIGSAQIFKDPEVCERLEGEEIEQCKDALDDGYIIAGNYYARLACILSVPSAWDDFFDDKSEEQLAEDERNYARIYQSFGYITEAEANIAVNNYWGKENFKEQVRTTIQQECPQAHAVEGFDLEAALSGESGV